MLLHNRLSAIVILIALALLASSILSWPAHEVALGGLSFALSGSSLLGLIAIGLAGTGAYALVRSHPKVQPEQLRRPLLHSILPTAVTLASWLLLPRLPDLANRVAGVVAGMGALVLLVTAEYLLADSATHGRGAVEGFLQLATYAIAALLFAAAHSTPLSVNAARVGAVVSAILALRLLGEDERPLGRILRASLGIGFLLGAASWLLHTQTLSTVTYSLTLVIFLYVLTGLASQSLKGKLRREVVLEYLLVGLSALVLLSYLTR